VRRALGVALVIVCLFAAPAAAKSRAPVGQRGCRFLAAAYDPQYKISAQTELARIALVDFKRVKGDAALEAITKVKGPYPMRNADLATWCKQHYPTDPAVRDAVWQTGPTQ
jgi:hypothetical protein